MSDGTFVKERRIFRQTFMDNQGNVTYGPEEEIDAGPFDRPGIGSFVELEDGWYRLRRKVDVNTPGGGQIGCG